MFRFHTWFTARADQGIKTGGWAQQVVTLQRVQPTRADAAALARQPEDARFDMEQAPAPLAAPAGLPSVEPAASFHKVLRCFAPWVQ